MAKISVSLSIEDELVSRISAIADAEGVTRSWLCQRVLAGWAAEHYPPRMATPTGLGPVRRLERAADAPPEVAP